LFFPQAIENNGEADGTRSGGLCPGSETLTSIFNNFESTGGIVSGGSATQAGHCVPRLGLLADLFGVTFDQRADQAS
jgi:hypothetical protein